MPSRLPVQILPATATDCRTLAALYTQAFLPTALGQAVHGSSSPDDVVRDFELRFAKLLTAKRQVLLKAVRDNAGEDVIVGFARWETPEVPGEEPEVDEEEPEWAAGTNMEIVETLVRDLEAFASTIKEPHYHREPLRFAW